MKNTDDIEFRQHIQWIMATEAFDDIKRKYFHDYGSIKALSDDMLYEFEIAYELHNECMKLFQTQHDFNIKTKTCKCGFSFK